MNLLVIGHSVADTIDYKGKISHKPGGIFYSVAALNNLKEDEDKISLVTAVDDEHYHLFKDEYDRINEKFFNKVDMIPKVHLKIEEVGERYESYENINQNLDIPIMDFNKYDGILINMITGFDLNLKQVQQIRKNFKGIIYFDVHTFSRGLDENMHRHFRLIPGFNLWAESFDFIQVNRNELFTLSSKTIEEEIICEVLSYSAKYLILTLEDEGAKIFFMEDNRLKNIYEPAIKIEVRNKVGCGDVFGASFFYSYISQREKNIEIALKTANIAAGCSASYEKISEFKNMKRDVSLRLY